MAYIGGGKIKYSAPTGLCIKIGTKTELDYNDASRDSTRGYYDAQTS